MEMISVKNVSKTFVLHNQNGVELPVLKGADLSVSSGECVILHGHSGSGKSTFLRSLYGNYKVDSGSICVRYGNQEDESVDLVTATPRQIVQLRQQTLGYVSQFLSVIPRVSAIDVVMEPLLSKGVSYEECYQKAAHLLTRLNVPEHLWQLAPATFSGGEQQRVNIARGFIMDYPILLLDEPTASLDKTNSEVVIDLIQQAKNQGAAIVGIFHDPYARDAVADRLHNMNSKEA
ncbi:phosphonate C-P lyase system protein PhnL [Vibrio sp. STUT-A11]|nr:phosphonate C-P lyase system protein PhnL [Vibrio sp. STUT-A11]BDR16635.1 phosphonate C-P lyase system protein PhnL [Vibrio sp. STUT-A11]